MNTQTINNSAVLIHLSALFAFVFPFGGIVAPLLLWGLKKDDSKFIDEEGKKAINFNVSILLYTWIFILCLIPITLFNIAPNFTEIFYSNHYDTFSYTVRNLPFELVGILSLGGISLLLQILRVVFTINASIAVSKGESSYYPLTIKFLK